MHHYAASWATLLTTATRRTDRVRDYAEFRRSAVEEGARAAGGIRSVVFARDAQGRADTLARRLLQNGIAVSRTRDDVSLAAAIAFGTSAAGAVRVPAGAYVVDLAQPQGRLARAILEPDAQLDSTFIREELESRRTGQDDRFYDLTAWAMPFTYRVRAWTTAAAVAGAESVSLAALEGSRPAAPPRAAHGYAFAPGSEGALRMLAGLLQDSVRVWYAPKSFRSGATRFPLGAFVVRAQGNDARVHDLVARHASAARLDVAPISSALVDEGTDLGSNSVVPVRAPRIALLGGAPVNGNSFGFAWFALDQRMAYPHTAIDVNAVADGALREFDVLVIPESGSLDRALGEGGLSRLQNWVRDGGVLVTLGSATGWLANERVGLSRLRARRDSAGPAGEGAPLPASVPGAIVRVTADTLSPLLAGIRDIEMPVLVQGERSFATPRDLRPGEVVLRHAPLARLRLAGYLWPEAPARLAGTPYLWTERVGRGRVIAFAGDPNFRDMWRGLLPIFGNAVLLGGSF